MNWLNTRFKLVAYFLLAILSQDCRPAEAFNATSVRAPAVVEGVKDRSVFQSDGSAGTVSRDVTDVNTQSLVHTRTLKQRTDDLRDKDEFECGLSSSERRRYFDDSTQQWRVTNEVLRELNNDIQAIVNCTSENDVVMFRSTKVIRSSTTITLPWTLTLRSDASVTLTCPQRGPLLVSRTTSFTLENLVIEGCNGSSSVIVLSPRCDGSRSEGISLLNHLTFQDNEVYGQGHILEANGQCSNLNITSLVFFHNRCIGTHCVVLGARNTLTNISLVNNQGINMTSLDFSVFFASIGSHTNATNVTSRNNEIRSFYVSNGEVWMTNSHFDGNKRNQSSRTQDNSIGGGVLFSNHSSVSISSTIFKNNSAFNGGALFAWSSNISINDCAFHENDAGEGNGGAIYGHYNSSFDISSSLFSKNRGYFGACVYSNYTSNVNMVNTRVLENNSSRSGGIMICDGMASIRSSEFLQNTAFRASGALGTISVKLSLQNSTFIGNEAGAGGACIFEANSTVSASALMFENNRARESDGGAIIFIFDGRLRLRGSVFQNNFASSDGGAIYAEGECETIFKRVEFLNNTSGEYAGALQIWGGNFTGSDLTFTRNRAMEYGGAISFFKATNISVSSSHLEGNSAESAGAIQFFSTSAGYVDRCTFVRNSGYDSFGGAVHASNSNVNISSSLFSANTAPSGGSLGFLNRGNATILNSTFENNVAENSGGAIFMGQNSSLILSNSSFIGNRGHGGGVLYVNTHSNASLSRVQFVGNYAYLGGCLSFYDSGRVSVLESIFSNNRAENSGGAIYIVENSELTMSNSTLVGNSCRGFGGGIDVSTNSTAALNSVNFDKNEAMLGAAMLLSDLCYATISNTNFTNNIASNGGGGLLLFRGSTASLKNSTFSDNKASVGGGLYILENNIAMVAFCSFAKNNASNSGGAIQVHESKMFLSTTQLDLNTATCGGSFYSSNASVEITDSTLKRNHAHVCGGAIAMSDTNATLEMISLESNEALEMGGGIYAIGGDRINATNVNVVSNLAGIAGGGIALGNASSLLCYSCSLLNNKAISGAGLFVTSNNSISIVAQLQNSRFENNTARSYGGGIEFHAPQNRSINCSSPIVKCGHIVLLNTSLVANYANHSGAIVLTTDPKRVLVDCEYKGRRGRNQDFLNRTEINSLEALDPKQMCASWIRNRVSSNAYGGLVGTYGQDIVLSIDPDSDVKLVGSMASGYVLENVRSGRQLPMINMTVLDKYGLGPAFTVHRSFEARISSPDDFFVGLHLTTIVAGVGNVSRLSGFVVPGNYSLEFAFNSEAFETFNVIVMIRECIVGEEPTRDRLTCQECDSVNYNFNPKTPSGCKQCPQKANCTGRYIVPNKGHWHKSPCHDTVQSCLVDKACSYKNRHETLTNFTQNSTLCKINETTLDSYNEALCNEGYKGPLCGSCKKSYGLSFRFQCFSCPQRFASFLTLLGLILYLLASSAITIKGTLPSTMTKPKKTSTRGRLNNGPCTSSQHEGTGVEIEENLPQPSSEDEESGLKSRSIVIKSPPSKPTNRYELIKWKTTEILKILINFLQTTAVAATVNVQWTDGVIEVFEASEYIGVLTTAASLGPIDCLISSDSPKTRSISRMLLTLFVPGGVIGIYLAIWSGIAYKNKQNMLYFLKRSVLSVIAVTYISYLGLTQMAVRVFYCVDVYDSHDPFTKTKSKYWAVDTAITCYGNAHGGLITIGVIVLLFVSIGFPLISALVLSQTKAHHRHSSGWQLETMGFLYRAFKEEFIYWESLAMLRKAFLSVIVVFSYPLGGQIQGLLAALVIVFGLYFHLICSPFRHEFSRLNYYESISLLVSCVTFILGQFFNAEKSSNSTTTLIAIVIIVANASFFAFLVFVLIRNVIEQLRESLQNTNTNISHDTRLWKLVIDFITFRLSALCCSNK